MPNHKKTFKTYLNRLSIAKKNTATNALLQYIDISFYYQAYILFEVFSCQSFRLCSRFPIVTIIIIVSGSYL